MRGSKAHRKKRTLYKHTLKRSQQIDLRRRAEQSLTRTITQAAPNLAQESVTALVHELQVHQIELELQCEQLQQSQRETEESRNSYRELYESIPIGYATIDTSGKIYDINPAGSSLLGLGKLTGPCPPFQAFIAREDVDRSTIASREVVSSTEPRTGELTFMRAG